MKYLISQVLVIIYYLTYSMTYKMKSRNLIIVFSTVATILCAISYLLLGAYTGFAMCVIAIIRNILFSKFKGVVSLISILVLTIFAASFSYQGIFSLLNIAATIIYTYSLWQSDTLKYKKYGILVNGLMILYSISIKSIMGTAFMIIAFLTSIISYRKREYK